MNFLPIEKSFKMSSSSVVKKCETQNRQIFFWAGDVEMIIC